MNNNAHKIVVTELVGFIGASLCIKLLERGDNIIDITPVIIMIQKLKKHALKY
tara:strand:- start:3659 stop:3817 length:159 start_codon:yes stop_codon:yes gene_type:complete